MSTTTRSRGKEGSDDRLFGDPKMQQKIKEAVTDLCYLLSRGYAEKSSTQLVGNRYKLNSRQQIALMGMAASDQSLKTRKDHIVSIEDISGKTIAIDGFNLLIVLESALSGAYVFKGSDGNYRDVSSVHGTYKRVKHTEKAIVMVGETLRQFGVKKVLWYFDSPVSNSGRLKTMLREIAEKNAFPWEIFLTKNPDNDLVALEAVSVSSDAFVLNHAKHHLNLAGYLIENCLDEMNVVSA